MPFNIEKYASDAHLFLKQVAREIGNSEDTGRAGRITVAVLHTLREKISVEESIHLISQLPLILKGVYVDGWDISREIMGEADTLEDFLNEIRAHTPRTAPKDFGNDQQAREHVIAVLRVMRNYVSEGEMNHIKQQMPKPIAVLFEA